MSDNPLATVEPRNVQQTFRVNGETHQITYGAYKTLLEVLREDLGLTGTKHGCELGECGACAVLVDGEPVLSCLALALESAEREITTVEGLMHDAELHPLQAAFASAVTFSVAASIPLIAAHLAPTAFIIPVVLIVTIFALAALGAVGALARAAPVLRATARVVIWGVFAMAVTAAIGWVFGVSVG